MGPGAHIPAKARQRADLAWLNGRVVPGREDELRQGGRVLRPPIEPMLARPSESLPPEGQVRDEIWQQKVDGYRVIAYIRSGRLYLQSRRGADLSGAFPDLVAAAAQVQQDLVLDGELVVLQGGRLDFSALQQRARLTGRRAAAAGLATPAHVVYFDLLEQQGESLLSRSCRERLEALRFLFTSGLLGPPWTLVASTSDRAVAQGWMDPAWGQAGIEGVVLRSGSRPYRPGARELIKIRAYTSAEAVIAGITGTLQAPSSLLLARYDHEHRLRLAARTTPLPGAARRELAAQLTPGGRNHPWNGVPFSAGWGVRGNLVFQTVQPDTVAEFRADTAVEQGRYRHPVRFLRIRAELHPMHVPLFGEEDDSAGQTGDQYEG